MALGKLAKAGGVVFRKIRGRIVPIKVEKLPKGGKGIAIGKDKLATVRVDKPKGRKGSVGLVQVAGPFTGSVSTGKRLFKRAMIEANKLGADVIKGPITDAAQVKIRAKLGTKFFSQSGKRLSLEDAMKASWTNVVIGQTRVKGQAARSKLRKALGIKAGASGAGAAGYGVSQYNKKEK